MRFLLKLLFAPILAVLAVVIAFLISPYGLSMLATWLLAKLHVLRYAIQDRIYG